VARYEVEVRNYVQKVNHGIYEVIETAFRVSDELYSLCRHVVCVDTHAHVDYYGIDERKFASLERGITWNRARLESDAGQWSSTWGRRENMLRRM
jgi:hypothetical protein